jgi:hypothetical protein
MELGRYPYFEDFAMITVNFEKSKVIAHVLRREARAREFAPLDEVFVKQIPGVDLAAVEAQRQQVRDKYAAIQNQIDNAPNVEVVLQIAEPLKLTLPQNE